MSELSNFIGDCIAENGWSNDIPVLDTQDHWYVFAYNKRRGKSSAYFTHDKSDAEFVSIAWTKSNIYSILNIVDGKSEYQLATPHGTDRILGEVWKVPTEQILQMDSDERNLLLTNRLHIPVIAGAKGILQAWIYITHPEYILEDGIKTSKYTGVTYFGSSRFIEIH